MPSYTSDRPVHPLLLLKGSRLSILDSRWIVAGRQVVEGVMPSGGSVVGDSCGKSVIGVDFNARRTMRTDSGRNGSATPRAGSRTVKLLVETMEWVGWLILPVLLFLGARAWLKEFINPCVLSPEQARLAITNKIKGKSPRPRDRFRIVLCWLENDYDGCNTKTVEGAFSGIGGIELVRSARIVTAAGAADNWRPDMRKGTCKTLDDHEADLAIVGLVKESRKVLNLWFVSREGDGTLPRGDKPYVLKDVSLQEDFHEDLCAQITVEALRAVAPLADTEVRGQVLDKELIIATEKPRDST